MSNSKAKEATVNKAYIILMLMVGIVLNPFTWQNSLQNHKKDQATTPFSKF
jgi:hypothetical protein